MSFKSFLTKIEGEAKSTVAWVEKALTEIEGNAPAIERLVDASLNYIGPVLQLGLGALGQTALAAEVGPVIAKAQNMLLAASATITDFGPSPTAVSAFKSVAANLSELLAAGQVKNPQTVATFTKAIAEIEKLGEAVANASIANVPTALLAAAEPAAA